MMASAVANGAAASDPGERPEWLCEGGRARWWSKRQNKHLEVTVSRFDEEKKRVVVTFDADPNAWKSVPYNQVGGNGPLQPAEEKSPPVEEQPLLLKPRKDVEQSPKAQRQSPARDEIQQEEEDRPSKKQIDLRSKKSREDSEKRKAEVPDRGKKSRKGAEEEESGRPPKEKKKRKREAEDEDKKKRSEEEDKRKPVAEEKEDKGKQESATKEVGVDARIALIRKRARKIYEEHNPSKMSEIDALFTKYAGVEEEMYLRICTKYGVEPEPLPPARAPPPPKEKDAKEKDGKKKKKTPQGFAKKASAPPPPELSPEEETAELLRRYRALLEN